MLPNVNLKYCIQGKFWAIQIYMQVEKGRRKSPKTKTWPEKFGLGWYLPA